MSQRPYVLEQGKPCFCEHCARAGCDKPVVRVRYWYGQRDVWLHGRDLRQFYDRIERDREGRESLGDRLRADHLARTKDAANRLPGIRAQRGDEPR